MRSLFDQPQDNQPPLNEKIIQSEMMADSYYPQSIAKQDTALADFNIMQINPEREIEKITNWLRGKFWNPQKKEYEQLGSPKMNEDGVREITGVLFTLINTNTILSNLRENKINDIMYYLAETLSDILIICKNYDLKPTERDLVLDSILNMVEITLLRAWGGMDRKTIRETSKTIQAVTGSLTPEQRHFSLFPFGKKEK